MMTRTRLKALTIALVMAALSAAGCGQKEIKQLHGQVLSLHPAADRLKASIELYLEDRGMPLITD